MGYYVETESKENWLEKHQVKLSFDFENSDFDWVILKDKKILPVVLLDNVNFKAAGIAIDKNEYLRFTDPRDTRNKKVYFVPYKSLKRVSGIANLFKE